MMKTGQGFIKKGSTPVATNHADEAAGDRLRKARLSYGYATASEAARRLGVNPVTYTSHENNTRGFTSENAIFYGEKFKVNPAWLMFGDEYASPGRPDIESRPRRKPRITSIKNELKILALEPVRIAQAWHIPATFLEHVGVHPDDARIAECVAPDNGIYLDADLHASFGDYLIIDVSDPYPDPRGMFAVREGEHVLLRDLRVVGTSDDVHVEVESPFSSRPTYRSKPDELQVFGRVKGRLSRFSLPNPT